MDLPAQLKRRGIEREDLNPLWVMAYDNFPLEVIDRKEGYLKYYRDRNSWFTFYHDPYVRACRLGPDGSIAETL
jgi:hypothetical protein